MKFKKIYIEITNKCNLSCSFCAKSNRAKTAMLFDDFCKIITKVKPYTKFVYLHVLGEPLTHFDLSRMLKYLSEESIFANITTNGTLLEAALPVLLENDLRQINISLHSFENLDDNGFNAYLNQTILAAKQLSDNGTYVAFRLWDIEKVLTPRHIIAINALKENFNPEKVIEGELEKHRRITLTKNVFLNLDKQFVWPTLDDKTTLLEPIPSKTSISKLEKPSNSSTLADNAKVLSNKKESAYCLGGRDMLAILVDGTVTPCCIDYDGEINLGNALSDDFEAIVSSFKLSDLVTGFKCRKAVLPLCQICSYRTRFDKDYKNNVQNY